VDGNGSRWASQVRNFGVLMRGVVVDDPVVRDPHAVTFHRPPGAQGNAAEQKRRTCAPVDWVGV